MRSGTGLLATGLAGRGPGVRGTARGATAHPAVVYTPRPARSRYALLCEKSFSTGTPTLCRAREAQSRWKNSST
ncbi:hypothetical protein GCM10017687_32490 [Streptomyces echinatus]